MSILVVGSVAYDTVETPFGRAERVLGGSASFFSVAASFFVPVNLVGVVGRGVGETRRSRPAARGPRSGGGAPGGGLRHHELLDRRPTGGTAQDAQAGRYPAHQ